LINFSALGPIPYPKDIELISFISISSANLLKSATGSDPEDNTNIKGAFIEESEKHFDKSNVGGLINSGPLYLEIQFSQAGIILSGLIAFKIIIF